MAARRGKPCGASHISQSKVCRVGLATEVNRAINAATGEIGAASLKQAVNKYAGPKGVARLREIRAEIRAEMGGNIVKGPKADALKKRLQEEGLLPPKGKSDPLPPSPKRQPRVRPVPERIQAQIEAAKERGRKAAEPAIAKMMEKSQIAQLQSVLGLGDQTRAEVGRDLSGLLDEAKNLRQQKQDQLAWARNPSQRVKLQEELDLIEKAIVGPKTNANAATRSARESAKGFDTRMAQENLRRDGDRTFDDWGETTGSGSKKLGQGAFGTVIKSPDGSYAVKRGDVSDTEAKIMQKIGQVDLGPKLIAADIDGPGVSGGEHGVNIRSGRIAMGVVKGSPIGYKNPDDEVGGVKVADAYWIARANLHRMGIAHNDMHIDNVLVDRKGKGRFVDLGLAQDSPKAALAEAMGAFVPPRGAMVVKRPGMGGDGDWQVKRWKGTAGNLLERLETFRERGESSSLIRRAREELENKAPRLTRVLDNKTAVMSTMRKDGFSNDDIAAVMSHGIRSEPSTYTQGVWSRLTDDQAMKYIGMLYDGI